MARVHLALGSNLGDRQAALDEAVRRLGALADTRALGRSSIHETPALLPPEDFTPQPDYLNAVLLVETALSPRALFLAVKDLERAMGRVTTTRWAPRVIDVDVVLWGEVVVKEGDLVIPHPRMHERRFVLEPLAELSPDARHPIFGRTVTELLNVLPLPPSGERGGVREDPKPEGPC
ncbi:MAG: 2-amino-4-hydroxy-6-hydroxymethyldihydropteridine diphosphokinase [Myxococcales bacterium]|nr:2-amino-4-hydroxy-6-hydroxymethyldihydropteridine diphosphokinase [Myxococcales bacterium]